MAVPKPAASANTLSTGFTTRMVQIQSVTPDGLTALTVDRSGTEYRVPMLIQRSKGQLPAAGEWWIIAPDISGTWTFAAIISQTAAPFIPAGTQPGSIPGTAITPGTLPGTALSNQAISNLQLSAAAAATNLVLDSQFTSAVINANRLADPATTCSWTMASPNATVTSGGSGTCILALMPSDLVPLYVNPGEQYYLSVTVTLPGGAPAGITAGIQFALSDGSFLGPVLPVAGGTSTVAQLVTIPPGEASAYLRLVVNGLPSGMTASFSGPVCYITIGKTQLQLNVVDAPNIVGNSITAAQIKTGIVLSGVVNSTVIEGAYFIAGAGGGSTWTQAQPSTPGYFMYYDSGTGNPQLAFAITAASGSDQWGNTWPGGAQFTGLPGLSNLLTVVDPSGNTLANIDSTGDISGQLLSGNDVILGGTSLTQILNNLPNGLVNRGWATASAGSLWPSAALGGTLTALLELDTIIPAGRVYEFQVMPSDAVITTNPSANGQIVFRWYYTSDGSTPSTSSTEITGVSPMIVPVLSGSTLNYTTPLMHWIPPTPSADTNYRLLLCGYITSGAMKFADNLEMRALDWGPDQGQFGNNGLALGSGTTGGSGLQTVTKTYYATGSASYYGPTAANGFAPNGLRWANGSVYQSCLHTPDRAFYEGDQYGFFLFNYSQIHSDIAGATINSFKVRLNCLGSYYSSGMTVILGYTTYTGSFGSTFIPGGGTHSNVTNYHINQGAILTQDITGTAIAANYLNGTASHLVIGPASSKDGYTDQNNYGWLFGYSATNHANCPAITITYTKAVQ